MRYKVPFKHSLLVKIHLVFTKMEPVNRTPEKKTRKVNGP